MCTPGTKEAELNYDAVIDADHNVDSGNDNIFAESDAETTHVTHVLSNINSFNKHVRCHEHVETHYVVPYAEIYNVHPRFNVATKRCTWKRVSAATTAYTAKRADVMNGRRRRLGVDEKVLDAHRERAERVNSVVFHGSSRERFDAVFPGIADALSFVNDTHARDNLIIKHLYGVDDVPVNAVQTQESKNTSRSDREHARSTSLSISRGA